MRAIRIYNSDPNLRMHPNYPNWEHSDRFRNIRIQFGSLGSGGSLGSRKGFSLVEALLAGSLFALLVTALVGAVIYGRESTAVAGARARAVAIAEEGLEATRNIRDSSFGELTNGNHGLTIAANQWFFSGSSDVVDSLTRQITITTPATNRRQTVSAITWQQTPSRTGSVALTTYHTNWRASNSGSGATCSPFCVSLGYTGGTCRGSVGACTDNGQTNEPLGDVVCTGGPSEDTCCCSP